MHRKRATAAQRIALALGLLGVALQLGAVTWHKFAPSSIGRADAQILADLQATICHSGGSAGPVVPDDGGAPSGPDHKADCLLCKGLADSFAAVLPHAEIAALVYVAHRVDGPVSVDAVAGASVHAPRSRGPPRTA